MDSILNTVKKMLGLSSDYDAFDTDILANINSAFMTLMQIGVGAHKAFIVTGPDETWADFLGDNVTDLEAVKQYVYLKVRLVFDPPASSSVADALKRACDEAEWRLNIQSDTDWS